MTRVGMITTRAQPEIGGIESHVAEVAGRIAAAAGYDLEVLTTDRSGRLPRVERAEGYTIRRFRAYPRERDWYLSPGLFWAALRARYDLVEDRTRVKQRIEKLLEDALIKISSVLTDVLGVSGRAMIEALTAGQRSPKVLAELAQGNRAQAVAERYVVSLATVRTQIRSVLSKLEVGSQLEAVALYRRGQSG